jgi:signal transduction histidine kinase
MESFAKPLLQTAAINFSFKYDQSLLYINLPMEKRKNFYLIFKELVNNVLKYAECKNVEVVIKIKGHQLELVVKDDGKGFDVEAMKKSAAKSLSGNGLRNMKRRAAEMNGTCLINSTPSKGTAVHLNFPIT